MLGLFTAFFAANKLTVYFFSFVTNLVKICDKLSNVLYSQ
ncbi:hypothetical protein SAMN03080617_00279 [Algoriphagus alkaliphilus]|uniref:Uncharacterized protein n=1 Tax=Algoriphagus alkaliphilus TaxID=279824 RepID=A0A1G5V1U0_9BACT|nr:hypothetical protein SAMN03080617_00279 [Algoriphagus alkaliphilus]